MSTQFYAFAEPVTSARIEPAGSHERLSIWTRHGLAGTLTVNAGDAATIAYALRDDLELIHVSWGGDDLGLRVQPRVAHLDPGLCIVGNNPPGEIRTVGEVLSWHGLKKIPQ